MFTKLVKLVPIEGDMVIIDIVADKIVIVLSCNYTENLDIYTHSEYLQETGMSWDEVKEEGSQVLNDGAYMILLLEA